MPSSHSSPQPRGPAHLVHVFPTFVAGGAQVRTVQLMGAFGADFRHSVVALDGKTSASELVPDEIDLCCVAPPERAGSLSTIPRLRRLLRELRPDLVCTYNWGAIDAVIAARLCGLRSVLHHEDGFGADEGDGFKRRRIWMRRLVLPGTAGLIIPSYALEQLALERWRLAPQQVHRIANGIHVQRFPAADRNPDLRSALGIPNSAFVTGSVGHLRPEKNPVRLVQAFAQLRIPQEAHLLVLGDGPERAAVEACAAELDVGARVHLVGHQSNTAPYYRAMDAFALSSNTEQMPVAMLEAMAARLPVVATDVGDVRRILPEIQHSMVTGPDAQAMAEALMRLAREPDLARQMAAANLVHVTETYTFEAMVTAHRKRIEAALGA